MFRLGESQELYVVKEVGFGIYLGEEKDAAEKVLLPGKEVPEGIKAGDKLEVFLYKDSKDRLIATTRTPKVRLGEVAVLRVADTGKIGAFLDWGLEKDLFLPFKEQTCRVVPGQEYLVALYVDKSARLAATMDVYKYMKLAGDYEEDDEVEGIVYEIKEDLGAFVAVDGEYAALIPAKEIHNSLEVGQHIRARVTKVREDGKLNLSIRQKAYLQMDKDAVNVLAVIEEFDGVLPYNDKAKPEVIERDFHMSKAAFKRAVGRLYKERKIEIKENCIRIVE